MSLGCKKVRNLSTIQIGRVGSSSTYLIFAPKTQTHTQKNIDEASWALVPVKLCFFLLILQYFVNNFAPNFGERNWSGFTPHRNGSKRFSTWKKWPIDNCPFDFGGVGGSDVGKPRCQAMEVKHCDLKMQLNNMRCLKASLGLRCTKI